MTALSAFVATTAMGVFANLPFALAPGMGLNAYFTYSVVGFMGANKANIDWKTAITAVFVEGLFFFVLSVTGARTMLAKAIPKTVKLATTGGKWDMREVQIQGSMLVSSRAQCKGPGAPGGLKEHSGGAHPPT